MNAFARHHAAAAYASVAIETGVHAADPHALILLLYDGAIRAIRDAASAMRDGRVADKGQSISKAIQIVDEGLKLALDDQAGGDIARQLGMLYDYIARRLLFASARNEPQGLDEALGLLTELREAWAAIGTRPVAA